jgi:hypothetical protein
MSNLIKRPAIPAPSGVTNWESLRRFLEPVKTLLEIHEGWRGRKGMDRFVPEWELSGVLNQVAAKDISEFIGNDTEAPGPPTNFLVNDPVAGTWGNNILTWTNPADDDLLYVEIYVNTVNSIAAGSGARRAGLVTVSDRQEMDDDFIHWPADVYADHYYWIRAVDWSGNYSEWVGDVSGGGNGAVAPGIDTVGELIDSVLEILAGQITETQLYADLTTRLDKIETTESAVAVHTEEIADGKDGTWASISNKVQVTTYTADITGPGGLQERTAIAEEKLWVGTGGTGLPGSPASDSLMAQWTVKLNVDNHIAGVGLALDDTGASQFIIVANQFAIVSPTNSSDTALPFVAGYVDDVFTVGISGQLLVDDSISARSIKTDELVAGGNVSIANGAISIAGLATDAYNWINSKAKIFRQTGIPTAESAGDLWFDTDDGNKAYRAAMKYANEIRAGEWELCQDQGAAQALLGLNSSGLVTQWVRGNIFPSTGADAPGSAGLWMTNTRMGYYNGSTWPVYITNSGRFWFGKDSNNYFAYTGGDLVFSTNTNGAFHVLDGGDITLYSSGGNPGAIQWDTSYGIFGDHQMLMAVEYSTGNLMFWKEGSASNSPANCGVYFGSSAKTGGVVPLGHFTVHTSYQIRFDASSYVVFDTPYLRPDVNNTTDIGTSSYKFRDLYLAGDISCVDLTPSGTVANFSMPTTASISAGSSLTLRSYYVLESGQIRPCSNNARQSGHYNYGWSAMYAHSTPTPADFYFFDSIKGANGEIVPVDDVAAIKQISGRGVYDELTGFELIDDDSIPEWLKFKHSKDHDDIDDPKKRHKKGDTVYDKDGRPFLDLKTMISLLMGAIRQLDGKIEQIFNTLDAHHLSVLE